jgi:hypothetical protein
VLSTLLGALALVAGCGPALALDVVRFPRPSSDHDARRMYGKLLLLEALKRTEGAYGPFKLEETETAMERRRLLLELQDGTRVNVTSNAANPEWLRELKAVMVPIDMGLQSWRIALLRKSTQARVDALRTPEELKQLRFGVASAWVTRAALEESGFTTVTGDNYDGLFGMLLVQRFDLFPRGVNEVFLEYDQRKADNPELAIEQRYLLHDRIPSLFFVSPTAPRLAERIAAGMEAMVKDGTLRRFMLSYYGSMLKRAQLCSRIVVELPNPPLPPELAARKELWFDPFDPHNGICPGRIVERPAGRSG